MPLYQPSERRLYWCSTVQPELTGNGGNTAVQPYQTSGSYDTITANTLRAGDRVKLRAEWEVTGQSAATNIVPNIYWGGAASGVALETTATVLANTNGLIIKAEVELTFISVGASPSWGYFGEWMSSTNNTYESMAGAYGLTSTPTNADITVEATVKLLGGPPVVGDKVKLRNFRRTIIRGA